MADLFELQKSPKQTYRSSKCPAVKIPHNTNGILRHFLCYKSIKWSYRFLLSFPGSCCCEMAWVSTWSKCI
uniref:Putative ovule protein n=1 Tax=Solanum chacoense TaxID=4108 RepID=A0A0V0GYW6_SOLCH